MSFLFGKPDPIPPVIVAPPPAPSKPVGTVPKTEVQEAIDVQGEEAAVEEVKKTKKRKGFASTILTSGEGILTDAPVIKKKLGE